MHKLSYLLIAVLLCGCADVRYRETKTGKLKGRLIVQWIDQDEFIVRPDKERPLTFTRYNNETITPEAMYTDGGSIPRPLWAFRSYSPWGYAPAFIMHDWLFHMKHCQLPGYERYSVEEAARVLSEVMKTIMEDDQQGNKLALYSTFEAVRSPIASNLWNSGKCIQPPADLEDRNARIEYVIDYP